MKKPTTLILRNDGILDPDAFRVFGLSAKKKDSPIGFFGTGLKYAIAVCLREGRKIAIHSGADVYKFRSELGTFRDDPVKRIWCNDEPLPFTEGLGKTWGLWQAYRELVSNMRDEDGEQVEKLGDVEGQTYIVAELGDIELDEVFLSSNLAQIRKGRRGDGWSERVEVYKNLGNNIFYYRGVRAKISETPMHYTYNLLQQELTEDRTFSSMWDVRRPIAEYWGSSVDEGEIDYLLFYSKDTFEETLLFSNITLSDEIMRVCKNHGASPYYIHPSLYARYKDIVKASQAFDEIVIDTAHDAHLAKAIKLCNTVGYPVDAYKIKIAKELGAGVMAVADVKFELIWVKDTFLKSSTVRELAVVLLEEFVHLKTGLGDETRGLQDWLFNEVFAKAEEARKLRDLVNQRGE